MNINPHEFLTPDQKTQIGKAYFEKIMEGINGIVFSKTGKVNINSVVQKELDDAVSSGNLFDYMDYQQVGEELGKVFVKQIRRLGQEQSHF